MTQATTTTTAAGKAGAKAKLSRKTLRKAGRDKRKAKLVGDKEFAKTYFGAKSKRANDKKAGYRKKKRGKK